MNYKNSIKLLKSPNIFQIKLGLDRVLKILDLLGNPQEKLRIIHVAGTNGKGSVCAVLANILTQSGYKTGLYTSPHLIDYTERIKIKGIQIEKENFASLIKEIYNLAEQNKIYLTEFEILTVIAFKYFKDNNVDIAVIETGLGGRYDATNICKLPFCSIITSISLDHTDRLGNSIKKIAFEKAGIIKRNCPCIVSKLNKGYDVIKKEAEENKSELISVDKNIKIEFKNGENYAFIENNKYKFPLLGTYQGENLALVIEVLNLLKKKGYKINLKKGLETVKWSARLEYIRNKNLLIDGAHNPSAASELKKSIDYYFYRQKKIYIYGTLNTKDYKKIAEILFNKDDEIYYYEFHHQNAVSYEEYKKNVPYLKNLKKYSFKVMDRQELKILTGSLYMIGEFIFILNSHTIN